MLHKRFLYESGLDIIVPLKHGTRWLEEKTSPNQIIENILYYDGELKPISDKTYWVYREPREYLISALKTEIRTSIEFGEDRTEYIVSKFINRDGHHWSGNGLFLLYTYWLKYNVIPIKLSELSNLFDNSIEFIKSEYQMVTYTKTKYDDTLFITDKVGETRMKLLYHMADYDGVWLDKILKNER